MENICKNDDADAKVELSEVQKIIIKFKNISSILESKSNTTGDGNQRITDLSIVLKIGDTDLKKKIEHFEYLIRNSGKDKEETNNELFESRNLQVRVINFKSTDNIVSPKNDEMVSSKNTFINEREFNYSSILQFFKQS